MNSSCDELIKAIAAANKAAAFAHDAVTQARDKSSRENGLDNAVAVRVQFTWWSSVNRSNTDNTVAEIRAQKALLARAALQKHCRLCRYVIPGVRLYDFEPCLNPTGSVSIGVRVTRLGPR